MKNIACAILLVGLCFYITYNKNVTGEIDYLASFVAFISAIGVFYF
jgi:hypothetical protein